MDRNSNASLLGIATPCCQKTQHIKKGVTSKIPTFVVNN